MFAHINPLKFSKRFEWMKKFILYVFSIELIVREIFLWFSYTSILETK